MILTFGKHSGESIYSVIKCDYSYCRWLHEQGIYGSDTEIGRFLDQQFRWHSSRDTRPIGHRS
jgi:hypothetical protein